MKMVKHIGEKMERNKYFLNYFHKNSSEKYIYIFHTFENYDTIVYSMACSNENTEGVRKVDIYTDNEIGGNMVSDWSDFTEVEDIFFELSESEYQLALLTENI